MNSAAAIDPPIDRVYRKNFSAWVEVHSPAASRTPALVANEVTISASTALAKSTTPFHSERVSTPPNPAGAATGGPSES